MTSPLYPCSVGILSISTRNLQEANRTTPKAFLSESTSEYQRFEVQNANFAQVQNLKEPTRFRLSEYIQFRFEVDSWEAPHGLPKQDVASLRSAVIVAPGGGCRTLAMESEGWQVAEALAKRRVAAFVLKYGLNMARADMAGFKASMRQMFSGRGRRPAANADPSVTLAPQIADATAAFELVRRRAKEWNVDPKKVGMIGFSVGAMLTLSTTLSSKTANSAFLGDICGPLNTVKVPKNATPLFIALAPDDPFFANKGFGLIDSWKAAEGFQEFKAFQFRRRWEKVTRRKTDSKTSSLY